MKPRFNLCERLATDLLLDSPIYDFPFDLRHLNVKQDIMYDTIQNYAAITQIDVSELQSENNRDGFLVIYGDTYLVLYNEFCASRERVYWTNAHETGHALLKHRTDGDIQEVEAHFLAASLIMPDAIIYALGERGIPITTDSLIRIFGVSTDAAAKKMNTLERLSWRPFQSIYRGEELLYKFWGFIERVSFTEMLNKRPFAWNSFI